MLRVNRQQAKSYQLNIDGGTDEVTTKRRKNNAEEQAQTLIFQERDTQALKYPALLWLFSTLNGVFLPPGLVKRVKGAGLTEGVPDMLLPVERIDQDGTRYAGLAIELKKKKNAYPTPKQREWLQHLAANGWRAYVCHGATDAWHTICSYLGISGATDHWNRPLQRQAEQIDEE